MSWLEDSPFKDFQNIEYNTIPTKIPGWLGMCECTRACACVCRLKMCMEIQTLKSSKGNNVKKEWTGEFKLLHIAFYYKTTVKASDTIQ